MTWNGDQLFASKKHDWQTPQHVFNYFDSLYKYELDAAATAENTKCEQYITPEQDALSIEWDLAYPGVRSVWLNPPYGRGLGEWMRKCHYEARKGKIVTALIMARTDTRWWHDWCMKAACVYLIKGRIRFVGSNGVPGNSAPAPSALVVWGWWQVFGPTFRGCEIPK